MQLSNNDDLPFKSVLDALPQQLCVLDANGVIKWVNHAWVQFCLDNGGSVSNVGLGTNYLDICKSSPIDGEEQANGEFEGIRAVIENRLPYFSFEYPCHSPNKKRWFMMEIRKLVFDYRPYFVASHHDITQRRLAEEQVRELAVIDSLTTLSNRRHFDDFLGQEWRRAQRLGLPVSLAFVDIDCFKQFNDNYGHVAGDGILENVGTVLKAFGKRPGDLVARYGGEEFAVIMGETNLAGAEKLANEIRAAIFDMNIPHGFAGPHDRLTVSIGVAMACPTQGQSARQLVEAADNALYDAKNSGRNCVSVSRADDQQFQNGRTAMRATV